MKYCLGRFLQILALLALSFACGAMATIPYEPVHGPMAAVYTPFDESGALNVDAVESQAAYLNKTGVRHILVAGTTGESVKLTIEERQELAEAWAKVVDKYRIRMYVHVGANALEDARKLSAHAEGLKAAGVVSMSSTYFRPSTVEQLAAEMQYVFAAAPNTPAYYYHIPSMTLLNGGSGFWMPDFVELAGPNGKYPMPTLVGVKFTDYDCYEFRTLVRTFTDQDFLYGRDEQLASAVIMGARGAVGSTYNFLGDYANDIFDSYDKKDFGALLKAQDFIDQVVDIYRMDEFAGTDVGKEIMNLLGVNVGPPRLPSSPMTDTQKEALRQACKAIGLL